MRAKLAFAGLGAAALIAGGYWAGAANFPSSHAGAAAPVTQLAQAQVAQPQVARPAAVQTLPEFTTIVEGNKAAVVNITSTLKAKSPEDGDAAEAMDEDDALNEFFRRCRGRIPHQQQEPQLRQGMGSGFIVEPG